jgi:hypothetical protein
MPDLNLNSFWIPFAEVALDRARGLGLGKGDASFFGGHSSQGHIESQLERAPILTLAAVNLLVRWVLSRHFRGSVWGPLGSPCESAQAARN